MPFSFSTLAVGATLLVASGTLYVADVQNGMLRSIVPDGRVRTVAGEPPRPRPTALEQWPSSTVSVA